MPTITIDAEDQSAAKQYRVYYRGKLVAIVVDLDEGFISAVADMNTEIKVEAIKDNSE